MIRSCYAQNTANVVCVYLIIAVLLSHKLYIYVYIYIYIQCIYKIIYIYIYKPKGSLCRPVPRGPVYVDQTYFFYLIHFPKM